MSLPIHTFTSANAVVAAISGHMLPIRTYHNAAQRMRIDDLGKYAGTPAPRRLCEPGTGLLRATDVMPLPNETPRLAKGVASQNGRLSWRWEELSPRYICNMSDVFFVHVGGNCGLNVGRCAIGGDPVWEYATQCQGWRGVVVEPSAGKFKLLKAFYRARVGRAVTPVHAAVSNYSGTASMPSGGSETSGLTEHQLSSRSLLPQQPVNVTTLNLLWQQFRRGPNQRVDFLFVDVEGSEPFVFDAPLPEPLPSVVMFEHSHLDFAQRRALHFKLVAQGYEFIKETHRPPQDITYGRPTRGNCAMPSSMSTLCTEHRKGYREVCAPDGLFHAPSANLTADEAHRSACAKRSSPYGHAHTNPFPTWMC